MGEPVHGLQRRLLPDVEWLNYYGLETLPGVIHSLHKLEE